MGAINFDTHPDLHQQIAEGNLRRQFDLLRDMVSVGLQVPFGITTRIIDTIHVHAVAHLVEKPGRYRGEDCHITGSTHEPPAPALVKGLMLDLVQDLRTRWDDEQVFYLAAFAFWRFCWIHPYEDGNGRTARALCYLIICLKLRRWLPGEDTLPHKMKKWRVDYTNALRHADTTHSEGNVDVMPLAVLLTKHTLEQVPDNRK